MIDLPKVPMADRSVGREFVSPHGSTYRPSMFVTLTLGTYGQIVPGAGTPARPQVYDYRRAALEALHFPKLFDRWVQNLRRCAGYRVQYFGAIEPQRRLAPHMHVAMRGAVPRRVIRTVTRATYLQLWWPSFVELVHTDAESMPRWDPLAECYRDHTSGSRLQSWEEALDLLDADPVAEPALVMRFGTQLDIKGIVAPSQDAERAIRYLTKYLTKSVSETYVDAEHLDGAYEAHIDRLHAEVLYLPCSPECANWLRYGIEPKNPGPGLRPGMCANRAHERENLGIGGRRVQVSRAWSGKTLSEHRADRAAVVREVLAVAGVEAPAVGRLAATVLAKDGQPRFVWEAVPVTEVEYAMTLLVSVVEAQRWRAQYESAKRYADELGRASPRSGLWTVDSRSATTTPRPTDRQPHQVA